MEFVKKQPSGNLLFLILRGFIKFAIMVRVTDNIESIRGAIGHGGNKKFFFPDGRDSEKRSAIVPTSRIDFLKSLAKRGRACSNSIASRKADGMNAHQIRTKATNGANSKKCGRYSVIRACCSTLKSMVLSLEGCLIWCTYRSNKTQHRNRVNLDVTQSLNQAVGGIIDFQHALYDFFGVPSNDEGVHQGRSWFQHFWHGTLRNSPRSMSAENHVPRCHNEPSSICGSSN